MQFTPIHPVQIGEDVKADFARRIARAIADQRPRKAAGQIMNRDAYGVQIESAQVAEEVGLKETRPFAVRWQYTNEERTNGEWQIFLPFGCVTVVSGAKTLTAMPVNDEGKNESGEDCFAWYSIEEPEDKDGRPGTTSQYGAKEWTVFVNVKPWPSMKATTKQEDKEFGATVRSIEVATICEIDFGKFKAHAVIPLIEDRSVQVVTDGGNDWFAVYYESEAGDEKPDKAEVRNVSMLVGTTTVESSDHTSILDCETVWVRIDHKDTELKIKVKTDLKGEHATSDADKTVFKIYDVMDGVVIADYRSSIPKLNFYLNDHESNTGDDT